MLELYKNRQFAGHSGRVLILAFAKMFGIKINNIDTFL